MNRNINEFNLTFGGRDDLEIHSFTTSLLIINDLLKEINSDLGTNKKIELSVKAYNSCCFDVYLQLVADAAAIGMTAGLFDSNNLKIAHEIIEALVSILNLKKALKGEKPKEIMDIEENRVKIEDNHGNIFILEKPVFNIFTKNEEVNDKIESLFDAVGKIPSVESLTIKDNANKKVFDALKENGDFKVLTKDNPIIESLDERFADKPVPDVVLSVFSIVFDDTRQWEFFYEGNRVPVKLKDPDFIDNVLMRKVTLLNGDKLRCDIIIHQKFNEIAQVYENKKYSIIKVHEIITPPPQLKINLNDQN